MAQIERPPAPYLQVIALIRAQIESGELVPGAMVPSDRQIAEQYGISRATSQKVLTALKAEGIVETIPGVGTRVRSMEAGPHRTGSDRAAAVRRSGRIYRPGEYARIVSAELAAAPEDVADALGVETDAQAIRRIRVTYGPGDVILSASTSWFKADLADAAPQLLVTERIHEGTWAYVEQQTGRRVTRGRDSIDVRTATSEDAALLGVEAGAALKLLQVTYTDADGETIEFGVSLSPSGRPSAYEYEVS